MIKTGNTDVNSIPGIDKVCLGDSLIFGGSIIPPEYTRLQYISDLGASALDTGIIVAETDRVSVDEEIGTPPGGDMYIFSCKAEYAGGGLWIDLASTTWYVRFGYTSSTNYPAASSQLAGKHTLTLRKNAFDFDGALFLNLNFSSMPSTTLNIGGRVTADGTSATGCFNGRIYEVRVVDGNGGLRWHGIPVKETDGTGVGLYDIVSGQFFQSVTSTPFTAGPNP